MGKRGLLFSLVVLLWIGEGRAAEPPGQEVSPHSSEAASPNEGSPPAPPQTLPQPLSLEENPPPPLSFEEGLLPSPLDRSEEAQEEEDQEEGGTQELEETPEENREEIQYDIPVVLNERVEAYLEFFQKTIRDKFQVWLARSSRYVPLMREIFKEAGLPGDLVFVALIESGFNPYAYSRVRAVGPWQFMRSTARKYGLRITPWVDERRDPIRSTVAAARYFKDLFDLFGSWPHSLASYNAGEGKVMRAMARTKAEDFWDLIRRSRSLRRETKDFVPKFFAAMIIAKNPEKFGFHLPQAEPLTFDEITVNSPTDLRVIAKLAGVSYKEVRDLNPELKKTITPPHDKTYQVRLPSGTKETYLANLTQLGLPHPPWHRHRIRKGETLSTIARRYHTTVDLLQNLNQMKNRTRIRAGEIIYVPPLP